MGDDNIKCLKKKIINRICIKRLSLIIYIIFKYILNKNIYTQLGDFIGKLVQGKAGRAGWGVVTVPNSLKYVLVSILVTTKTLYARQAVKALDLAVH